MSKKIAYAIVLVIVLGGIAGAAQYYMSRGAKKVAAKKTYQQQVQDTTGKIEVIGDSLTIIRQECKKYPDTLDELIGDGFCSKSCPQVDCLKPEDLFDAWGNRFDYFHDKERLTIRSRGKDGREGGAGEDEDFTLMLPMNPE